MRAEDFPIIAEKRRASEGIDLRQAAQSAREEEYDQLSSGFGV
jgi:hypothetical protein